MGTVNGGGRIIDQDALYYPYMHIRDVEWLKRNLLLFPHVARIAPPTAAGSIRDAPEIRPFVESMGGRDRPLLRVPHIFDHEKASDSLVYPLVGALDAELTANGDAVRTRFGKAAAEEAMRTNPATARLYLCKAPYLLQFLERNGLAWRLRYEQDPDLDVVGLHPRLGEAIMMILAISAAKSDGLEVVTDNIHIHRTLAERDLNGAVRHWIGDGGRDEVAPPRVGRKLALAVFEHITTGELTVDNLAALSKNWEARGEFLAKLREVADGIPEMTDEGELRTYVNDRVSDILKEWRRNKGGAGSFMRRLFPEVGESFADTAKNVIEKLADPAAGGLTGLVAGGSLLSAAAGFAVGVVTQAIKAGAATILDRRTSPYRYLSLVERAGLGYSIAH